jgi:PAS domain S-box-containing protein
MNLPFSGDPSELPNQLAVFFNDSPRPLAALDASGHGVMYVNPAFCGLVGQPAEALISQPPLSVLPEGMAKACGAALESKVPQLGEVNDISLEKHDSTVPENRVWGYAVWPILNPAGEPAGLIVEVTDITEMALSRLRAMEMNQALLVSSVRQHELTQEAKVLNEHLLRAQSVLEEKVAERTAELDALNCQLTVQVKEMTQRKAELRSLLGRLGKAEEEERKRISRDLHDRMSQMLAALNLRLTGLEESLQGDAWGMANLQEVKSIAGAITQAVNQLATELRPTALDDLGLVEALSIYVEKWASQCGMEADFQSSGIEKNNWPADTETALYRIAIEALTNVLRHAGMTRVSVTLQQIRGLASLVVEDYGRGFQLERHDASGRLGLLGMRERAEMVGGTLTVESTPGTGTTVIVRVPLATTVPKKTTE